MQIGSQGIFVKKSLPMGGFRISEAVEHFSERCVISDMGPASVIDKANDGGGEKGALHHHVLHQAL